MSNMTMSSLDNLPTEMFHRIFDFLNTSTIIFNLRPISKRFRAVVNSYDRFNIDSRSISTIQFDRMCRLIRSDNVISLILSGISGQLSIIDLPIYIRLQRICLFDMDEIKLKSIVLWLHLPLTRSFSLSIKKYDDQQTEQTQTLISSILTGPFLHRVELNLMESRFPTSLHSNTFVLEHLTLHALNDVNRLGILLESSPHLHTLVLKRLSFSILKLPLKCFPQLKSLTIEQFNGAVDRLEPFLLWTPELTHLKIRGRENTFDANRWEDFVQIHLKQLTSFEFDFFLYCGNKLRPDDFIQIFEPFQSSFWLEQKKWFMTCSHMMSQWRTVHLYSSPMNSSIFQQFDSDPSIICNDQTLNLCVNDTFLRHLDEKKSKGDLPFFSSVNNLKLKFLEENLTSSMESLWSMIDISRLVQIEVEDYGVFKKTNNVLIELKKICEKARHLSVLVFRPMPNARVSIKAIESIISILPPHLDYLNMPITSNYQIKTIENRCRNLMTIRMVGRPGKTYVETTFVSDSTDFESDPNFHL